MRGFGVKAMTVTDELKGGDGRVGQGGCRLWATCGWLVAHVAKQEGLPWFWRVRFVVRSVGGADQENGVGCFDGIGGCGSAESAHGQCGVVCLKYRDEV